MGAIMSRMRNVLSVGMAATILFAALCVAGYTRIPSALAYSCGDTNSGHCYGILRWATIR